MRLSEYPRSANGSKRGIHWSASCYPAHANYQKHLDTLAGLGMGWVKFLSDGNASPGQSDSGLGFAVDVRARGMVPVARYYVPANHRWTDANSYATEAYVRAGVRYIETINEPDLDYEWSDKRLPKDWAERAFGNWIEHARRIIALGGIPLSPSLASGFLQTRGETAGQLTVNPFVWVKQASIERFVCSIHNYALNHPIDYPFDAVNQEGRPLTREEYDRAGGPLAWDNDPLEQINAWRASDRNPGDGLRDDDACFLACEIFREMLDAAGYTEVPILTTEGGPCLTDRQDRRYPRMLPGAMQAAVEAELRYMASKPWYLGYCWWLWGNWSIGGTGGWGTNQWVWPGGPYSDSDGFIPIVRWLRERPLSADGAVPQPPQPDPGPEPTPESAPEEGPMTESINDATAYGVTVQRAQVQSGEMYYRIVKVHHLTPEENNGQHHLFGDVLDTGGQRINGVRIQARNVNGMVLYATVDKPASEPGTNFPLGPGDTLDAWVATSLKSDTVRGVHTRHPDEGPVTGWGHMGNAVGHHSFLVIWQAMVAGGEPEPPPDVEPPIEPPAGGCVCPWCGNPLTIGRGNAAAVELAEQMAPAPARMTG